MIFQAPLNHVQQTVGVIAGVLVLATCIRLTLQWMNPKKNYSELRARIRSWYVIAGLLLGSILLGRREALIFLAMVSYLALKEFLSLIPTRRADRRVLFWLYLSIPFQYYFIGTDWYGMFLIFIPVYVFMAVPIRMVTVGETKDFLRALGLSHWAVMISVFSLSHLAYLLMLPSSHNPAGGGAGLLLFVILITEGNDVAQYIWGKLFGKHPVVPTVSPKKTWEGLVGGVVTTSVLSMFMGPYLTPLHGWRAWVTGVVLGIVGFFGDVSISAIKRDLGVKDSGNWIPGHGGILDRVDSLTFTAPLYFHMIRYWYY